MTNRSEIQELRNGLRAKLLKDNTLLLEGDIEDNYPTDGDKIDAALNFEPGEYSEEELLSHFTDLPHEDQTDLEAFLNTVFSTT